MAAILLVLLPVAVAFDFGGVLRWTQYVSAFVVIAAAILSCAAIFGDSNPGGMRQHVLLVPLVLWLGYSWLQTVPLSPGLVQILSPGSYAAYNEWLAPLLPASDLPTSFPISLARHDSLHAIAFFGLVIGVVFASAMVFHTRPLIAFLLGGIAVGTAAQAAFGLARLAFPSADLFGADLRTNQFFGTFVNRNNVALFMNLGIACSLGLLSWRLMGLTGQEVDDDQFEMNDLVSLVSDRYSIIAISSVVLCIGGILLCGSRGGMLAMLFGSLFVFGWIRQRRGWITLPIVLAAIGTSVAVLFTPLRLSLTSIKRFEFFSPKADTILNDGRLAHWPYGWDATMAHLPTGSGLSTYAYAYLPHQGDEIYGWAHHADNLWLELLAEQGVFGVLFAISVFVILIRSLRRLGHSPDPIDQGLRSTGWYIIGAVIASQFFDFGLIVPANLFAVTLLVSAIISRDASNSHLNQNIASEGSEQDIGSKSLEPPRKSLFREPQSKKWIMVAAAVSVALPVLSVSQLSRSAVVESVTRNCRYELSSITKDKQALEDWAQKIEGILGESPEPELLVLLADVEYREARLAETIAGRPKSVQQADEIYKQTNPANRRLSKRDDQNASLYQRPHRIYEQTLSILPLGREARTALLYLDFVDPAAKRTNAILDQLSQLHQSDPATTVLLGEYAADSGRLELAADLWKSAVNQRQNLIGPVLSLSKQYSGLTYRDVIPDKPERVRVAASQLLRSDDEDAGGYLTYALDAVACDECDSLEEKGRCLTIRGDIAYTLSDFQRAFEQYRKAIECEPANANVRLKLVHRLRSQGRNREALIEARKARFAIPSNARFDTVIKQMAADDLRQLEKRK